MLYVVDVLWSIFCVVFIQQRIIEIQYCFGGTGAFGGFMWDSRIWVKHHTFRGVVIGARPNMDMTESRCNDVGF